MQGKVHNTLSGTYFPKQARTNAERRRSKSDCAVALALTHPRRSCQVAMRYRGCQARLRPRALERVLSVSFRV
jgi:hypothetical protein